ncbi:MAG: penicillin-binding protein 2 [Candidatus Paceibacterota bacterium]|jgi:cell division protein FtsI/penicillin-binding protein 2
MASVSRIRLISLLVLFVAALIITRLFYVQVIHGSEYSGNAERQYAVPSDHIFDRGSILFKERGGDLISAATLESGYILVISPEELKDREDAFRQLSSVITLERDAFMLKANKNGDPYEELAHRVSKDDAVKIGAMKIPGVSLYTEKWRVYPGGTLAAQVLGFLAYKGDDYSGRYGLENYYNDTLTRVGGGLYINFFAEVFTNLKDSIFTEAGKREGDLILTIDPAIQSALEKELAVVEEKYKSEVSGGIIINPKDGSIYAMAKAPTFDLGKFQDVKDVNLFNNQVIEGAYEMGSILKPLTMAAALDAGAVTATTTYNDKGSLTLSNYTIYNFDKKPRGIVNMQAVLNQSLNLGAVFAMQKLGKDKFRDYMLGFGLGEKTGIDLPGEGRNLISNLNTNRDIEFANASFGQGIALTPVSITRALSVLANGGYLVTPHLVEKIEYKTGFSKTLEYPKGRQVIKPEASEEISRMLTEVVDSTLLGEKEKITNYSIAAKTGTAQLTREDGKGYYDDRYLHSFFGYFPSYDPEFLVFLFTRNPQGETYASHTLKVPFMNLAKFLINYYEIPPDR